MCGREYDLLSRVGGNGEENAARRLTPTAASTPEWASATDGYVTPDSDVVHDFLQARRRLATSISLAGRSVSERIGLP